jgi:cyclophilin family peptidyl-prolyl cis-trans isomerase
MLRRMEYLATPILLSILCFPAALAAQEGNDKPKSADKPKAAAPQEPAKTDARGVPKDDAVMAKDPAILAIDKFIAKASVDTKRAGWRSQLTQPPLVPFDAKSKYYWNVETSKGLLKVELFPDTAPMHVTCGIYLSRLGFYDGLKLHRIIKGFMAQGGCPQGTGGGGPGYMIEGEFFGDRKHDKAGALSTANTGMPKSDGSQFFLTFRDTPHLDGKHTIWGQVVEGMDTLKALEAAGTEGDDRMKEPPTMVRTWISVTKEKGKSKTEETPKEPASPPKPPAK